MVSALLPKDPNGMMFRDGLMRWEIALGKIQLSERCYEMAFVFRRDPRLCE